MAVLRPARQQRLRFVAAADDLSMLSSSGPLDAARDYATQRARMLGRCSVFRVDVAGLAHVETVFGDGSGQYPLFPGLSPVMQEPPEQASDITPRSCETRGDTVTVQPTLCLLGHPA